MTVACTAEGCTTASWDMIPDPECDGCGRPMCSGHASLLDVDACGRPLYGSSGKAKKVGGDQWLCEECQESRMRLCVHGHDLVVVGVVPNGSSERCGACAGRPKRAS